jgi:hypothetical protein
MCMCNTDTTHVVQTLIRETPLPAGRQRSVVLSINGTISKARDAQEASFIFFTPHASCSPAGGGSRSRSRSRSSEGRRPGLILLPTDYVPSFSLNSQLTQAKHTQFEIGGRKKAKTGKGRNGMGGDYSRHYAQGAKSRHRPHCSEFHM